MFLDVSIKDFYGYNEFVIKRQIKETIVLKFKIKKKKNGTVSFVTKIKNEKI